MGRRRKFKYGEMAIDKGGQLWAIVDYYQDNQGRGRYRGIRVTNQYNGKLYGDSAWLEVYDLRQALAKKAQELGIPHDQFSDWDRALEYLLRMWEKNKRQDLQKAMFYMNKLLEKLPEEVSVSGVPYKVPSSSILSNGV